MTKSLIVKQSIKIDAPPTRVWEILTKPQYIRKWDELPENFGDYEISPATVIEWPQSRLNVVEFRVNEYLRYQLYVPTWQEEVSNIGYTYAISVDDEGYTWLTVEIGDFTILVEGENYYNDSIHFGETASHKIKELAEKKEILL